MASQNIPNESCTIVVCIVHQWLILGSILAGLVFGSVLNTSALTITVWKAFFSRSDFYRGSFGYRGSVGMCGHEAASRVEAGAETQCADRQIRSKGSSVVGQGGQKEPVAGTQCGASSTRQQVSASRCCKEEFARDVGAKPFRVVTLLRFTQNSLWLTATS